MANGTLFEHFALRAGTPERCATDALSYLLSRSKAAREALHQLLTSFGFTPPEHVYYEAQALVDDGCIPDVVGYDDNGLTSVIIEGKFWAALTEKQPAGYLQRFPADKPGLLLFVAPAVRLQWLWKEILDRCEHSTAHALLPDITGSSRPLYKITNEADCTIALCSWNDLLTTIANHLAAVGETETLEDVRQLMGLCSRMDETQFRPLQQTELDPMVGERIHQFTHLIDMIVEYLEQSNEAWLSRNGKQFTGGRGWFGHALKMHDLECWFGVSCRHWAAQKSAPAEATPLWLELYGQPARLHQIHNRVTNSGVSENQCFEVHSRTNGHFLAIGLRLRTGIEEHQIIRDVVQQLSHIANRVDNPIAH